MKNKFVVHTPTKGQFHALMKWAEDNGYEFGHLEKPTLGDWAYNNLDGDAHEMALGFDGSDRGMTFCRADWYRKEEITYGPVIDFAVFAAIQGIPNGPEKVKTKAGIHTAIVDFEEQTVTVDRVKLSFLNIKDLHTLSKKYDA